MKLQNGATYRLENRADGRRSLNVYGNAPANLANVCLWNSDDNDICQQWVFKVVDGHRYFVCKGAPGLALDLFTGSSATANVSNFNAHVYAPTSTSYLIMESASDGNSGYCRIRLANNTAKYLTANQGSNGTGAGRDVNAAGNVYWYKGGLTDYSQDWKLVLIEEAPSQPEPGDTQKLRLPINGENCLSASRNPSWNGAYAIQYKQPHYGADLACAGNTILKGLGRGTVVGAGWNKTEGNYVSVLYNSCIPVNGGATKDIVVRYFHMNQISVNIGDDVTTSVVLGYSGNKGEWAFGAYHVHIEVDRDTANPNSTPSIPESRNDGGLCSGTDFTCENPFDWFYTYNGQSKTRYWESDETWVFPADMENHKA